MFQQEKQQKNVDRNAPLRITNGVHEHKKAKTKINGPNSHTLDDKLNLLLSFSKTIV
jgi:hypothetical protein